MKQGVIVVVWVMVLLTGTMPAEAAEEERDFLGIITGDVKSTAHQVGMDLKSLARRNHIELAVFDSSGSVENIFAVYQRPGRHMGVVQSDVLAFVAKVKTDPQLELIAEKIKWVFPLYDQEVHILSKEAIHSFSDLHGKRVAIGYKQSGAYLTSRLLFEISGVLPRQMVAIGPAQALTKLKAGSVDAIIIVDGFPVERLALDVGPADGLHLVPVTDAGIRNFYPVSRIPSGTYPWQATDVDTVSVKAILIAYDYRNHYCNIIGSVARLMRDHLQWLRFNGHPKWKTVDLDATVKGWDKYKCVTQYTPIGTVTGTEFPPARKPNPVADAIDAVFRP